MKESLRGQNVSDEEAKTAVIKWLKKQSEFYKTGIHAIIVFDRNGDYVEK